MAPAHPKIPVLIAGAGPVGLTAAIELSRRGVGCRIVDPVLEPPLYAKAVGVQPRTLEVFEGMGVLQSILDAGTPMRGQFVFVNGRQVSRLDLVLPADVPFGYLLVPQYETERVLREELARRGVGVERGVRLAGFEQDADGVTATLSGAYGEQVVRADFLVGADGAHSVVRKGLGLTFEGAAFAEQYMLGDVEVNWSLPPGYAVRSMHQRDDGVTDDLLVAIPLPGRGRYRMTMLVPPELSAPAPGSADGSGSKDDVAHGFSGGAAPELHHIQAVLDRLSPEPVVATNPRWSSVFRISHRIVDRYAGPEGSPRVFVAGDAAHIHPPTGAQGMNTGIQDAHNLAWKLAIAVTGDAADGLLDSYDAERRPVGEEVVGRTVRNARAGITADSSDPEFAVRRDAQLLIDYAGSPLVVGDASSSAGRRAPDARGLTRAAVTEPFRLFTLLGRGGHTLLIYIGGDGATDVETLAAAADEAAHGHLDVYVVTAPDTEPIATVLPVIGDAAGDFAAQYGAVGTSVFLVRPDGHLAFASTGSDAGAADGVVAALRRTFRQ